MGGVRKSPAQKDVTKITVSGLIRPETGTYIYIDACHIVTMGRFYYGIFQVYNKLDCSSF